MAATTSSAIQHPSLAAEPILEFAVVESRRTLGDDQHHLIANAQTDCLGDLFRLHAVRLGGQRHCRRTGFGDDDGDVGGMGGEEGTDGIEAHGSDVKRNCLNKARAICALWSV